MHLRAVEEIVKVCRQREREGDCPTIPALDTETLEDTVITLASEIERTREKTIRTLGEALTIFAPDLAKEIATRWETAKQRENAALDEFLAAMRRPLAQP